MFFFSGSSRFGRGQSSLAGVFRESKVHDVILDITDSLEDDDINGDFSWQLDEPSLKDDATDVLLVDDDDDDAENKASSARQA